MFVLLLTVTVQTICIVIVHTMDNRNGTELQCTNWLSVTITH